MTDINFKNKSKLRMQTRSAGWSSIEGHIKFLVEVEYPEQLKNTDLILTVLNREVERLTQLDITISDGILDVAEANLPTLLEAKRVANAWYGPVQTYGTYAVDNLSDWRIWDVGTGGGLAATGTTPNAFTLTGDKTAQFPNSSPVTVNPGSIIRPVASSSYQIPPTDLTTVNLQAGPPIPLGAITAIPGQIVYVYNGVGWDSDAAITQEVEAWETGYDHLTHPIGLTGTYGIRPRKDQLEDGRDLQLDNKSAIENWIQWYAAYKQ